jgi:hypothetical protein
MAVSSIMGAYTWVIYDQLRRLRSGDFARGDVGNAAFRFVIAVPFGYALGVFDPTFGVGLAFLVGVFPTRTLFTFGRRLFNQQFKMGEAGSKGTSELEQLQNVGRTVAERFQDEGITTIAQLAWNDPIDMTIRTNLDFNFVVDCMSQSLLAIYVGSDLQKLAKYSLRGAQEVTALLDALKGSADGDSDEQGGTEGKIALGPAPRPLPARGAGTSTAVLIRRKMKLRWKERMRRLGRQAMVAAIAPGQIVARAKGAGQFVDCDVAAAEAALKGAAAALGIDALSLYYTLTCVAEDPYSKILVGNLGRLKRLKNGAVTLARVGAPMRRGQVNRKKWGMIPILQYLIVQRSCINVGTSRRWALRVVCQQITNRRTEFFGREPKSFLSKSLR